MATVLARGIDLDVSDTTGQKKQRVRGLRPDSSVGDWIPKFREVLGLPELDSQGRPLAYQALHEGEGRHLHGSEVVGDALKSGDHLVLHPNVEAGGLAR